MKIVVVGSVAYDTVETPAAKREEILGGSAVHLSAAASHFAQYGSWSLLDYGFTNSKTRN